MQHSHVFMCLFTHSPRWFHLRYMVYLPPVLWTAGRNHGSSGDIGADASLSVPDSPRTSVAHSPDLYGLFCQLFCPVPGNLLPPCLSFAVFLLHPCHWNQYLRCRPNQYVLPVSSLSHESGGIGFHSQVLWKFFGNYGILMVSLYRRMAHPSLHGHSGKTHSGDTIQEESL